MGTATASVGPARVGKRVDLAPKETRSPLALPVAYVGTGRPLRYGKHQIPEGVEVPGAADWHRVEAWVAARRIRPVYGDDYITFEDYLASLPEEPEKPAPQEQDASQPEQE